MDAYFDIDVYSRTVSTTSAEAQLWFDRGLVWTYGYSHEEAAECFRKALAADPECAMAWWGLAYALGPNYNMPWAKMDATMRAARLAEAHDATQRALALRGGLTPPERALVEALPARYPRREPPHGDPQPDLRPWNDAFAEAMRAAHAALPDDLEITTVFVEAIMNRTPWKMWDLASGEPAPRSGALEAQAVLERAFDAQPEAWAHPGALHLYVHLMEMSATPERALKQGDRLRELVPDAGHLIHMPTHIDVLCGHYRDVLHWNLKAIERDRLYYERLGPYNIYAGYRLHNYHFAIYGAMFLGQMQPALDACAEMVAITPPDLLDIPSPPMADYFESYLGMRPHILVRFGRWAEIVAEPMPEDPDTWRNLTALWRYAKGVAHAALGEVAAAEREQALFVEAKARVPASRLLHNNRCVDLLAIAEAMLEGEIEYRKGNYAAAFAALRLSVERDDSLPYDEPWGWMQPARHALGALLLEQGRVEEAEAAYREDLGLGRKLSRACVHPDNVWSLRGLMQCLEARGAADTAEGLLIRQRLDLAAARADVPVNASCFCARAAA